MGAVIVGGLFSLTGIWLKHYLQSRSLADRAPPELVAPSSPSRPAQVTKTDWAGVRRGVRRIGTGLVLLVVNIIVVAIVVNYFRLDKYDHVHPWWEPLFAFIVIGAVPVWVVYRIASGLVAVVRAWLFAEPNAAPDPARM